MTPSRIAALALALCLGAVLGAGEDGEKVLRISARKFEFTPSQITLEMGVPVVLELVSEDRVHGFELKGLGIRTSIKPGQVTRLRVVPEKVGRFVFRCDIFCGKGHEDMTGEVVVQ